VQLQGTQSRIQRPSAKQGTWAVTIAKILFGMFWNLQCPTEEIAILSRDQIGNLYVRDKS
jgi:hypothetical protein